MIKKKDGEFFIWCGCYHTKDVTRYTYDQFTGLCNGSYSDSVGVCWGTRECEECNCGGNELKCTHYPEKRKEAEKKLKERIGENNKRFIPKEEDMKKIDPTDEKMMKDLSTFTTTEKRVDIGGNSGKVFVIDKEKKLSYLMLFENGGVSWYKTGTEKDWKDYRGEAK